jgi:hypothetical protein
MPGGAAIKAYAVQLSFGDFAGTNAGSADLDPRVAAIHDRSHPVQVDIPPASGDVVGVADSISKTRPLAANSADLWHWLSPDKIAFYQK